MTTYPTTKQTLPNPTGTDELDNVNDLLDHDYQHSTVNDTIEALEDKVGIDGDTNTSSHSYKLSEVTGSDKAVGKSATQTLTNKTLGSGTKVSLGGDATGDMYQRASDGSLSKLQATANGQIPIWNATSSQWEAQANPAGSDASATVKGVVEIATTAEITAGTNTGSTGAVLAIPASAVGTPGASKLVQYDATGKLPAVSGENLTNLPTDKFVGTEINTNYQNHIIPFFRNPAGSEMIGWTGGAGSNNEVSAGGYCFINPNGGLISLITKIPGSISNEFTPADNKEIRIKTKIKLVDTGDIKAFGLTTSTAADIYSPQTATTNGLVRFVFNGTSLFANNSNGTAVTNTAITGITLTAWNTYEIVFIPGASIAYYVNGVLVATHTTNLPTTGTQLLGLGVNTNGRQFYITPISISIKN